IGAAIFKQRAVFFTNQLFTLHGFERQKLERLVLFVSHDALYGLAGHVELLALVLEQRVFNVGIHRQGNIGWQRPWRSSPGQQIFIRIFYLEVYVYAWIGIFLVAIL